MKNIIAATHSTDLCYANCECSSKLLLVQQSLDHFQNQSYNTMQLVFVSVVGSISWNSFSSGYPFEELHLSEHAMFDLLIVPYTQLQDKYRQKKHFSNFGIPLTDFMEVMHRLLTSRFYLSFDCHYIIRSFDLQVDTLHSIEGAAERFGYPLMVKSKRLAYDGRGNAVAQKKEDLLSSVVACKGFRFLL